jgi:hypothetical protein
MEGGGGDPTGTRVMEMLACRRRRRMLRRSTSSRFSTCSRRIKPPWRYVLPSMALQAAQGRTFPLLRPPPLPPLCSRSLLLILLALILLLFLSPTIAPSLPSPSPSACAGRLHASPQLRHGPRRPRARRVPQVRQDTARRGQHVCQVRVPAKGQHGASRGELLTTPESSLRQTNSKTSNHQATQSRGHLPLDFQHLCLTPGTRSAVQRRLFQSPGAAQDQGSQVGAHRMPHSHHR